MPATSGGRRAFSALAFAVAATLFGLMASGVPRVSAQTAACPPARIDPVSPIRLGPAAQQFVAGIDSIGTGYGCWWIPLTGSASWLTAPNPYFAPGGNGFFGFADIAVGPNATGAQRIGQLTLNEAMGTITVIQEPVACITVPGTVSVSRAGGVLRIPVGSSHPDCGWGLNLSTLGEWARVTSPSPGHFGRRQGLGPGFVDVGVSSNEAGSGARSSALEVGGVTVTITQEEPLCVFSMTPSSATVAAGGGTGTVALTGSGADCRYTALAAGPAIITSGASGSVPATIAWSVPASPSQDARVASISVRNATLTISQAGPAITSDVPMGVGLSVYRPPAGPVAASPAALVRLVNAATPTNGWSATSDQSWVTVLPSVGSTPGRLGIGVDAAVASGFTPGVYTATVSVSSSNPAEGTRQIPVSLFVADDSSIAPPRTKMEYTGEFSSGAIPITGWALSDVGIERIAISRSAAEGEPAGSEIFIGNAVRVRGARPDVTRIRAVRHGQSFPYPDADAAGWGYMLLSNVLPNGGNGTFTIYADLFDLAGRRTRIGGFPLTLDNAHATKPFGTIDTPGQGQTVSGTMVNAGWVLTPSGKSVPVDGSTIRVYIDGVLLGPVESYNHARPDVKALFPGLANSDGPAARLTIDTTLLADGVHTIAWGVIDDAGVPEGIGSRHFTVENGAASLVASADVSRAASVVGKLPLLRTDVWSRDGVDDSGWAVRVETDERGNRTVHSEQGRRLELFLDPMLRAACGTYDGHLLSASVAAPLPPGASLEARHGIFRWQPAPDFTGTYPFVFVHHGCDGVERRIPVVVIIGRR